jgi:glycine cleavage system aminomethyltransferase T
MAKFVVNSTATCALRIEDVEKIEVVEKIISAGSPSQWWVALKCKFVGEESFEVASSKEAAQSLAATILAALEA